MGTRGIRRSQISKARRVMTAQMTMEYRAIGALLVHEKSFEVLMVACRFFNSKLQHSVLGLGIGQGCGMPHNTGDPGAKFLKLLRKSPRFVAPIYQRACSWDEPRCGQLWYDIIRVGNGAETSAHFVGSIGAGI